MHDQQFPDLIIIGASVRAAAHSAIRAGYRPMCADLFADRDLLAVAPCLRIPLDEYPHGLARAFAEYPDVPWMYTGGLENYPDFLEYWSQRRILYGTTPENLESVRNPIRLCNELRRRGIGFPELGQPIGTGRRLVKPYRSAGGRDIREWRGESLSDGEYLQEVVDGLSVSAIFVPSGGLTQPIRATQQLIGAPWLNAPSFQYCGSIGPIHLSVEWSRIGDVLNELKIEGVVGVDAFVAGEKLTVIEVNPRYTASVEVLEHATSYRFIEDHCLRFAHLVDPPPITGERSNCVGKAVFFAPRAFQFPEFGPWDADLRKPFDPWRLPMFADIPHPGSQFQKGDPVVSFFVKGPTPASCLNSLQKRAGELQDLLLSEGA